MRVVEPVIKTNGSQRRLGGLKAKRAGQTFEMRFLIACGRYDVAVTRIPDSCRRVSAKKLIQIKSPFDFALSYMGRSAFVDTKTVAGSTFPNSHIDPEQVHSLMAHEDAGTIAGYVINFAKTGTTIFVPASQLIKLINVKGSISAVDAPRILGTDNNIMPFRIFTASHSSLPPV